MNVLECMMFMYECVGMYDVDPLYSLVDTYLDFVLYWKHLR